MYEITVRRATVADLSKIHFLIHESYTALTEHYGNGMLPSLESMATKSISTELVGGVFEKMYLTDRDTNFWVAVDKERGISGCVGVKRSNSEESQVVRMAVDKSCRNSGIGGKLLGELFAFCLDHRIMRILLTTANPLSAKFYGKNGFVTVKQSSFTTENSGKVTVSRMCKYLGEKILRHVTIVGGTHGNERVGVELVKQWRANPDLIKRATFDTVAICGNPKASEANRRYLDEDLNRLFTGDALSTADNIEGRRARELDNMLGPKVLNYTEHTGTDFIVDLHSSNSAVGLVAMISSAEDDLTALRLSQYLRQTFPDLRVTSSPGRKHDSYSVDSIAPNGIAFEIGPLVHGTLSSGLLEATRQLVQHTLYFLDKRNIELITEGVLCARQLKEADAPIDNYGSGEFDSLTTTVVSAALAPVSLIPSVFPELEQFIYVASIGYPTSPEVCSSSGCCSSTAVNYILHPAMEGSDWTPLLEETPLFIAADGSGDVVLFEREKHVCFLPQAADNAVPPEEDDQEYPLYPLFVNEAAYQSKGIACALYRKLSVTVY